MVDFGKSPNEESNILPLEVPLPLGFLNILSRIILIPLPLFDGLPLIPFDVVIILSVLSLNDSSLILLV